MPPEGKNMLVWCGNRNAGRGVGWYIASFHRNAAIAATGCHSLKFGEAGWVTTEAQYGETIVLALPDVWLWSELPAEPLISAG